MTLVEVALTIAFLGCFAGAAVLAAAEVSIIRIRRSEFVDDGGPADRRSSRLLEIIDDLPIVLNTVLLVVLLLQVAAATIGGFLAARWFGGVGVTITTIVLTALLFVYAEAIPKTRAVLDPGRVALRLTPLVWWLNRLIQPVAATLLRLAGFQARRVASSVSVLTESEIRALTRESADAGEIAAGDAELVERSFLFNDCSVVDVMVPRPDIVAVAASNPISDSLSLALETGHRRLPVYRDGLDDMIGVVRLRDLAAWLNREPTAGTESATTAVIHCDQQDLVSGLLRRMQQSSNWLAVVTDEGGRTVGLVTIEDIVAELVGEIADEREVGRRAGTNDSMARSRKG